MRAHRLQRLKLLTQGAALLGLGVTEAACHDPREGAHINAPYIEPDAGAPSTAPPQAPVQPTQMNAPFVVYDAGNAPAPSASGSATGPSKPPALVATGPTPSAAPATKPLMPHMNATATPPKHVNSPPKE
jgi:hypothetical protein